MNTDKTEEQQEPLDLFNYQAREALILPKKIKPNKNNIKIYSKVSNMTHARLQKICVDHGFKSTYQLIQYLIHCFLRVMDKDNDQIDEPVPNEIEEMFTETEEWDKHKSASCFTENLGFTSRKSKRNEINIEDF